MGDENAEAGQSYFPARSARISRALSARLLLALLEECNPDASNNRMAHGRTSATALKYSPASIVIEAQPANSGM